MSLLIFEDMKAQREGLLSLGFWALLVYRFGHARYRLRSQWLRLPWTIVYLVLNKLAEIFCGIVIGGNAVIGRRLVIEHHGAIVIHGASVIGDDCIIRQGVTLGVRRVNQPNDTPQIGDRVDIGAGAKILGAVRIGDDASIGANAVVLCDVPAGCIAVGVPATVRSRHAEPH
jgi:serine O-acetyltransferase